MKNLFAFSHALYIIHTYLCTCKASFQQHTVVAVAYVNKQWFFHVWSTFQFNSNVFVHWQQQQQNINNNVKDRFFTSIKLSCRITLYIFKV